MLNKTFSPKQVFFAEVIIIALFSTLPLFQDLPYRVNLFLTWEGAYRLYIGQMPFRDFGLPLGYGFWIIPFVFFKIFGPYFYSLVMAQSFINLISLIALRAINKIWDLSPVQSLLSLLVFSLSFVMVNFWPWYNHTVFVYELIGLFFILFFIIKKQKYIFLIAGAIFFALCMMTKQDLGGISLIFSMVLMGTYSFQNKTFKPILIFLATYGIILFIFIYPFLNYNFGYWFNYGQPPHFSRINAFDFLSSFFQESLWLKFYIIIIFYILIARFKDWKAFTENKHFFFFTLFTLGILGQAIIIQVTSFSPPTTTYYYHTFAFGYFIFHFKNTIRFEKITIALVSIMLILLWRSENYWKYSLKIMGKFLPASFSPPPPSVVSKNTWSSKAGAIQEDVLWKISKYKAFSGVKLPSKTIEGIDRIHTLEIVKRQKSLSCLNMSNLTPLALDLGYTPISGSNFPLWYHKGVVLFDKETNMLCQRVNAQEFDLILFEVMPDVDSFFSFDVRDCLLKKYKLVDKFPAPTGYQTDFIEVYVRP